MGTLTIYGDTADGRIYSIDNSYANARAGTGVTLAADSTAITNGVNTGQSLGSPTYQIECGFIQFDTSVLAGLSIISAVLSLYGSVDESTQDFSIQARLHDWGAALTIADWVAGADLSSKTLLATFASSAWSIAGYNDFADVALAANLNAAGFTRMLTCSDRMVSGTAPVGVDERVGYWYGDEGANKRPKLTVVTAQPGMQMLL